MRRKELHIKQAELAETLEISNNHMSSIENGRQKPSLDTFIRLCDCLNVTPDYLVVCTHIIYRRIFLISYACAAKRISFLPETL